MRRSGFVDHLVRLAILALPAPTLALGIGATTAIASLVYGVPLRPLPFREPDRARPTL